ncbi:MAG: hypothetical protein CL504_01385 [Actinobacteria bacterium]|nr:hypothetical protein [Actinomycetota bacterium]
MGFFKRVEPEALSGAIAFLVCACSGRDVACHGEKGIGHVEVQLAKNSTALDLQARIKGLET